MTVPFQMIVLGAGGNTFSEIRRRRTTLPLQTIRMKNLLSAIEPLPINIRISLDGLIEVKITGQDQPIMSAVDKNPLPVQYISFSSWGTTEGKWFYDCKINSTEKYENDLEMDIPELTVKEKLRAALFSGYDVNVKPEGLKKVFFDFKVQRVTFDSSKSVMSSTGIFLAVCLYNNIDRDYNS